MIASFIPFFLVARMMIDDASNYGPEYVFEVKMNVTSTPLNPEGVQISNYTIMNMFCRPKSSDVLNCRLNKCRRQTMDLTNDYEIEIPEEELQQLCSEHPFEVKFNENAVEYLIVHEDISVLHLNDLKLLIERLSIGADLNGVPDKKLEIMENTTVGQCAVAMEISHFPMKGSLHKLRYRHYELESLPQLNKVPGEAIVIQKTANLSSCTYYAPFYFGSYGRDIIVEADLHSHLESSSSRIYVADTQFVSSMTRVGTLGSSMMNNLKGISQCINVALRDIRVAKEELREIPEAAKTTILINSVLDKIYRMK